MYNTVEITKDLYYVGGSDRRLLLFESAYPVPRGISYNSYLLTDEKTALFDTVDPSVSETFFENVESALGGRELNYLIVQHVEPDHSASFTRLLQQYPGVTVVASRKAADMLCNYYGFDPARVQAVKEGDTLVTGSHTLHFLSAPMVHWPEVTLTYDETAHVLFSADAFGTFGALGGSVFADEVDYEREFLPDARRYYTNIVGKYGAQVQSVLKKASALPIQTICPLHGPVWRKELNFILHKYALWSGYEPEEKGAVIFYASVYGHTKNAAEVLAAELVKAGVPAVKVYDASVPHVSELVAEAFRYSHLVFAATTYNNGIFPSIANLITHLKEHNFQNRKFSVVENGSWAPQSGGLMEGELSSMKGMAQLGGKVTLLSAGKEEQRGALVSLAKEIAADLLA